MCTTHVVMIPQMLNLVQFYITNMTIKRGIANINISQGSTLQLVVGQVETEQDLNNVLK